MSKLDKEELQLDLDHQQDMLKQLREMHRTLELQEVQFGLSVPPHITNEIQRISTRIHATTKRISELETLLAQDQISLAEAEYRTLAADAWKDGELTIQGSTKLELMRLKYGIKPEKAEMIEKEIKIAIIDQIFRNLEIELIFGLYSQSMLGSSRSGSMLTVNINDILDSAVTINQTNYHLGDKDFVLINLAKCIKLDYIKTFSMLYEYIRYQNNNVDISYFENNLITINRSYLFPNEKILYEKFIQDVKNEIMKLIDQNLLSNTEI